MAPRKRQERPKVVEDPYDELSRWLPTRPPGRSHRVRDDRGQYTFGGGSLWFEQRVDPEWWAAYRLMPHPDDGRPVIAEVRVFPYEDRRPGAGLWSGNEKAMPSTGITSDVLRKLSTWRPLQFVPDVLAKWERDHGPGSANGAIRRAGFGPVIREPRDRPGRRGRDDTEYALIASYYVDACAGPRPLATVAAKLTRTTGRPWDSQQVRDALVKARDKKLLTKPPAKGRAGGQLTKKARDLLTKAAGGRRKK